MRGPMQITLNGETRDVESGTTVARLLDELGLPPRQVAVELNRELVTRDRREATVLTTGDRVEVVTLVGGG